ncbi:hypothetical protein VYU27_009351 [Nannochloropsis oceanica]
MPPAPLPPHPSTAPLPPHPSTAPPPPPPLRPGWTPALAQRFLRHCLEEKHMAMELAPSVVEHVGWILRGLRAIQQPYEPISSSFPTDFDSHKDLYTFFLRLRTYNNSSSSSQSATAVYPSHTLARANKKATQDCEKCNLDEKTEKEEAIYAFVDKEGVGRMRRRRHYMLLKRFADGYAGRENEEVGEGEMEDERGQEDGRGENKLKKGLQESVSQATVSDKGMVVEKEGTDGEVAEEVEGKETVKDEGKKEEEEMSARPICFFSKGTKFDASDDGIKGGADAGVGGVSTGGEDPKRGDKDKQVEQQEQQQGPMEEEKEGDGRRSRDWCLQDCTDSTCVALWLEGEEEVGEKGGGEGRGMGGRKVVGDKKKRMSEEAQ